MYVCLECEELFDEPKYWLERHGFDFPLYEELSGCPFCGGSYVDAIFCDGCDDPIIGEYVEITNGDKYCESCFILRNIED